MINPKQAGCGEIAVSFSTRRVTVVAPRRTPLANRRFMDDLGGRELPLRRRLPFLPPLCIVSFLPQSFVLPHEDLLLGPPRPAGRGAPIPTPRLQV